MTKRKSPDNQLSLFDGFSNPETKELDKPSKPVSEATPLKDSEVRPFGTRVIVVTHDKIPFLNNDNAPEPELSVERKESGKVEEQGDYATYQPQIIVQGSKDHPTQLCESLAMASIDLPKTDYKPNLPQKTIDSGILSNAQLEDVILAGHAHNSYIHNGDFRRGFMVGSGTGFGKGNAIAGIILDNFRQGRKKAVWISKNENAHFNSSEYWVAVGGKADQIINHSGLKPDQIIKANEGVLVTTYGVLRSKFELLQLDDAGSADVQNQIVKGRVRQMIDWLGRDFDGIIAFDESHIMANAMDEKGSRGIKKGSLVAEVGIILQKQLPKARIIYSSATGATEVQNLVYGHRLGLYGPGTPFKDQHHFVNEIKASGVTAMELVARDMKALGIYTSRSLSYSGVSYDTVLHEVTDPQRELYDTLARAWQTVLQNIEDAIVVNNTGKNAKAAALSSFWSSHQRFFNLIILTIQFPSVARDIQKHLDQGDAIIIQLTSTNEAQTKRALTKEKSKHLNEEISLESLDISPKSILIEYLNNSFPVTQYEDYEDDNGNIRQRVVTDSKGEPVLNWDSVQKRDQLIAQIEDELVIPQGPLDSFIETFGADNVAEVTGRTLRLIDKPDPITGEIKKVEQRRTPSHVKKEIREFLDDQRKILVFSEAGGTGGSFHADKRIVNQRRRVHYAFQLGWRADVAVQGFGRSHRSNQVCPPLFKLCSTDIAAQKRFLSSIARRLEQLGALTKGQRSTGGQGILDNSYNFESGYAESALEMLYLDIFHKSSPITMDQLQSMMGLRLLHEVEGEMELNKQLMRDIKKFLNRILSLEIHIMNDVFNAFEEKINGLIKQAKLSGQYDEGITHIKALSTELIEEVPIYEDERTKAKAMLTTLKLNVKVPKKDWALALELRHHPKFTGFYQQINSGNIYAVFKAYQSASESGLITTFVERVGITNSAMLTLEELNTHHNMVQDLDVVRDIWNEQYAETPDTKVEMHSLIKGLLLPIWHKIPGDIIINRYIDDAGNTHLGRFISQQNLANVRTMFEMKNKLSIREIVYKLNQGYTIELDNGWKLKASTIQSIPSIEFFNVSDTYSKQFEDWGMMTRIKNKLLDTKTAYLPKDQLVGVLPVIMKDLNLQVKHVN